ncbi:xanthine dehydrogenase family protein molybdopterin-binding subunit [Ramlibacter sp. AW1]|uniref:Xanthine dehydrogenase family protein molybdopterin-binding subunit n=1 Tax=Ramlibacter aurantiacus TaxID=2801330 RepID=A0A937D6U1_9BURK|nr:xanthine dehydrogenase family protein molybdopterin-binding subunit [Ramlibacter aurantiacus]MBL0422647.1 xanthine dehydrogenase family protein molybdopterin-binding subunit [Ramlibacter aurantiacus]
MGARDDGKLVGTYTPRVEDERLLTGRACFADDIRLDNMLHAAIVRSSVPHGRIVSIDTEAARALPGVHAVFTAQDVQAHLGRVPKMPLRLSPVPEHAPFEQTVVASNKVRYVGEPLAIVVADSVAIAEDAANLVFADIEHLPAVADWEASARDDVLLFEHLGTNCPITYTAQKGDALSVTGPYVRRERFVTQRHSAVTMETRGLVACWDGDRMTVSGAAKVPFTTRRTLAASLDLALEQVDMIEVDVGGGFGVRGEFYPEDFLVPFASRMLGRPVKWIEDRLENLLGSNHSRQMECELEIVCELDGRILALRGTVHTDSGAYMRSSGAVPPRNVAQFMSGPYDIEHIRIESSAHLTNKGPIGTYRGPGRFEADYFRERLMQIAADELGIDPVEFRRMNLVRSEQMPYPLATLDKPNKPEHLDSGDYRITLDRCLKEFDWEAKKALQGKLVDGRYHGIAIGCFIEGGGGGIRESARLEIEPDGRLTIYVGSTNLGQGMLTVLTQIAADEFGLPMDRIQVRHGSTTYLKEGFGSFHSRSTALGGSAVVVTAATLREKIREAVAARIGCAAAEVTVAPGLTALCRGEVLDAAELGRMGVKAEGQFASHDHTYAYGASAAHVAVDVGTGKVDLIDYFGVEDIGKIINPLTAKGQSIGAVVQGLGGVFLENLAYSEDGQFLAGTLADYLMPTATDFPQIRAMELENSPSPHNPLGVKGCGEGGLVPVGGVVANAVAAALSSFGVQPNVLPLTPTRVWEMLQEKAG